MEYRHSSCQGTQNKLQNQTLIYLFQLVATMGPKVGLGVLHLLLWCKKPYISAIREGVTTSLLWPQAAPYTVTPYPHDPTSAPAAMGATWAGIRLSLKVMGSPYLSSIRSIFWSTSHFPKCYRGMGSRTAIAIQIGYIFSMSLGQTSNMKNRHSFTAWVPVCLF